MAVSAQIRSVTVRCPFEHIVVGFHKQKTCVLRALRMQVAQLQKLIGEKDAQIHDVKAKSRDLQVCVVNALLYHAALFVFGHAPATCQRANAEMYSSIHDVVTQAA
jgi:hypothetical protein